MSRQFPDASYIQPNVAFTLLRASDQSVLSARDPPLIRFFAAETRALFGLAIPPAGPQGPSVDPVSAPTPPLVPRPAMQDAPCPAMQDPPLIDPVLIVEYNKAHPQPIKLCECPPDPLLETHVKEFLPLADGPENDDVLLCWRRCLLLFPSHPKLAVPLCGARYASYDLRVARSFTVAPEILAKLDRLQQQVRYRSSPHLFTECRSWLFWTGSGKNFVRHMPLSWPRRKRMVRGRTKCCNSLQLILVWSWIQPCSCFSNCKAYYETRSKHHLPEPNCEMHQQ